MKKLMPILLLALWPMLARGDVDSRANVIPGSTPSIIIGVSGHPLMIPIEVNIAAITGSVGQGASGTDTDPWNMMLRNAAGTEIATVANPLIVDLGANNDVTVTSGSITIDNAAGASAVNVQDGGNSLTIDGTVAATQSGSWTVDNAAGASAVNVQDGGNSLTIDSADLATLAGAVSGTEFQVDVLTSALPSGASTSALQTTGNTNTTAIELNTDSPTVFASGPVTVTTSATLLSAASTSLRSRLVRNIDSNTVLFVGPTSGVTTDNGLPLSTAGATGSTGNGGTVIYTHTAAVWGIVSSGTATAIVQSESD